MEKTALPDHVYDTVIIGAGPAGLTAGLYASRAHMKTILIEGTASLSQIVYTDHVENYPGFPEGISGFDLNERFKKQALRFGLKIVTGDVSRVIPRTWGRIQGWEIRTGDSSHESLSCIIAAGTTWKKLEIPGEDRYLGKGISYCATCDAPFYKDKDIVVIGGGDAAIGEAIYLTKFARKITVVHRRDRLRASGILQKRAFESGRIEFIWNSKVEEILGDDSVSAIRIRDIKNSEEPKIIPTDGVFIFIGMQPSTQFVRGLVDLDENGYILVDSHMNSSAKGIFACGDCIHKVLRQVVTACSDGATAAYCAHLYLEELKGVAY